MAMQDSLDSNIQYFLSSPKIRHQIIEGFWNPSISPSDFQKSQQCDKYFSYYTEQCRLALHDSGRHILARTHRDILEITAHLTASTGRRHVKELLLSKVSESLTDYADEIVDNTIDLAIRLLIMVNVGGLQYGVSDSTQLSWRSITMQEFLETQFTPSQVLKGTPIKLEKIFNARNLERIAGIKIVWTNNLADHLSMRDDDTRVSMFHYASFLEYQHNNPHFPPNFITETLTTLALFFPQHDKSCSKWYRKLALRLSLDAQATRCGHLKASDRQIDNFVYWHDRLVILKQVFDEAEPGTLSEWWYDRRKGVQWYTFWVAVVVLALTIFFGAVQCVEGGLQVYKAYYP